DMLTLTHRFPVTDLSWVRLTPWRELLAGLFEGTNFRPFLDDVRSASVAGKAGPRHLLGGWLSSRLALRRAQVHLADARHVTIEIKAEHEGRHGQFVVSRPSDDRMVEASVTVEGGPSHRRTLRLRPRSRARVLGEALCLQGRDHVYEQALAAAIDLI